MRTTGTVPIEFESLGDPSHPVIVLIMGLGMQLTSWPDGFCQALVDSGFRVVRFDNRDSGLSAQVWGRKPPHMVWAMAASLLGLPVRTPYTLQDMAGDAVRVMDALQIERAHIVGVSMGGMIGQVLAAHHPQRVLSLTSIMSSSGNPRLSRPSWRARQMLMRRPADTADAESVIGHLVDLFGVIGSPAYPEPAVALRQRISQGVHRAYAPAGTTRQLLAIIASGDRRKMLTAIKTATLVIHGRADPLVPLAAGQDTAKHVPGAKMLVIDGMGHDLPTALLPQLSMAIIAHCRKATD
jgi:proline iminopeptidase